MINEKKVFMICGIDEAGRGPVLGSLVIAGVLCDKEGEEYLKMLGVRDSKKLDPKTRERLHEEIVSKFDHYILKIPPKELDRYNLNFLEAMKFAEIIHILHPKTAYVDCADAAPKNFYKHIVRHLPLQCNLVVEHRADEKYPIVSAASIVAKVERDREIEKLKEEYGDIGSGYPSDPKTVAFLEKWFKEKQSFPHFVRKSWRTLNKVTNSKLLDFL
jgi:ribonuclease HII